MGHVFIHMKFCYVGWIGIGHVLNNNNKYDKLFSYKTCIVIYAIKMILFLNFVDSKSQYFHVNDEKILLTIEIKTKRTGQSIIHSKARV